MLLEINLQIIKYTVFLRIHLLRVLNKERVHLKFNNFGHTVHILKFKIQK